MHLHINTYSIRMHLCIDAYTFVRICVSIHIRFLLLRRKHSTDFCVWIYIYKYMYIIYIYILYIYHSRRRSDLKYLDLQIIQFSWILFWVTGTLFTQQKTCLKFWGFRENEFDIYRDSYEDLLEILAVVIIFSPISSVCGIYAHTWMYTHNAMHLRKNSYDILVVTRKTHRRLLCVNMYICIYILYIYISYIYTTHGGDLT